MAIHQRLMHRSRRYLDSFTQSTGHEAFQVVHFPPLQPAELDLGEIEQGVFRFLNKTVSLGSPINWQPGSETKLWTYNLHYFDYGRELARLYQSSSDRQYYLLFRSYVDQWIQACPVARAVAWDAYTISLRINNWLRAYSAFAHEFPNDEKFSQRIRASMYSQVLYLEKHLEYQLQNNHLLENGRTLWLASYFFNSKDAIRWRQTGSKIVWGGLDDNFFADGGNDELSPMYHQIMLDMYQEIFDVIQIQNLEAPSQLSNRLHEMKCWLHSVLHPDGQIPLLNDSAFGICSQPALSIGSGHETTDGLTVLSESGYYVIRDTEKEHFLIFDAGPMGADHRSGHTHCDTLSYELSVSGRRIIVDSGVSDYYSDFNMRNFYRSTRAHNTVSIDNEEQSEIWDIFRVARRARPKDIQCVNYKDLVWVSASHTGYERLKDPVTHHRKIAYIDNHFWLIVDHINANSGHTAESFIHFDPATDVVRSPLIGADSSAGLISRDHLQLQVLPFGFESTTDYSGETDPIQGWYASEFGKDTPNKVWGLRTNIASSCWFGYVIWPDNTDINMKVNQADGHQDQLQIGLISPSANYQLNIDEINIISEKSKNSGAS